ncbi:diguanylate cyclase domain-containing protein [Hydrogenimonas sp.]
MYSVDTPGFHYREEVKQAHTRFIYIAIIGIVLLWLNLFTEKPLRGMNLYYLGYIVASLFHFALIERYPEKWLTIRKPAIMFLDTTAPFALIYFLEEYGFVFSVIYLWVILGNGIRFGTHYLYFTMTLSLVGIALTYFLSDYWHMHPDLVLDMALTVVVLPLFAIKLLRRIQEKNEALEKVLKVLEQRSKYDPLTHIPNRFFFELELHRRLVKERPFSLFFIDLDGFKEVNDRFGHDMGDLVLKEVAARLQKTIGEKGFIARLGGDEFVAIVDRKEKEPVKLGRDIVDTLRRPYGTAGKIDTISASVGISLYPSDATEAFTLKKYADMAMYEVKKQGKNGCMLYADIGSVSPETEVPS